MKGLLFPFVLVILLTRCDIFTQADEEGEKNNTETQPETGKIKIGQTFIDKNISVKFDGVRLVDDDIIVIDISITNKKAEALSYSAVWSWGSLLTPEGKQLETIIYLGSDDIQQFAGNKILPGATIQEVISMKRYTPIKGNYIFYTNPPLPSGFSIPSSEKMSDFQIEFSFEEIVTTQV